MMTLLEIHETIKKQITIIKKTIIKPGIEAIIAIPKGKDGKDKNEIRTFKD